MVTGVLVIVGALVGLRLAARRRKAVLAGLTSTRPVFSIDPPARRHNKRKHEAL